MSQPLDPASAEEALIQAALAGDDARAGRNDGATALHLAAFDGNAEVVQTLLAHGADPSLRDEVYDAGRLGARRRAREPREAPRRAGRVDRMGDTGLEPVTPSMSS